MIHDINAVHALIDHALDASDMALDALETPQDVESVSHRSCIDSPAAPPSAYPYPPGGGYNLRYQWRSRRVNRCLWRGTRPDTFPACHSRSSIKTVLTLGKGVASGLPGAASHLDPIELFAQWFHAAEEVRHPAVGIGHARHRNGRTARPSVRIVLLKEVDEHGFVFYTNYGSRKAIELDANPNAALCFYWAVLAPPGTSDGDRATYL